MGEVWLIGRWLLMLSPSRTETLSAHCLGHLCVVSSVCEVGECTVGGQAFKSEKRVVFKFAPGVGRKVELQTPGSKFTRVPP